MEEAQPTAGPRSSRKGKHTPVMQQYIAAKESHPDAIVFFRLGDFYEMFFEDAVRASELLEITLTARGHAPDGSKIPMAGVPHHAAPGYIAKLLEKGQKVAVCEQMQDPAKTKGIVSRQVVRVVTPGLCLDPDALDARAHNYLVAVTRDQDRFGVATLELTTAELRACAIGDAAATLAELVRLEAREVLVTPDAHDLERPLSEALPRSAIRSSSLPAKTDAASILADALGPAEAAHASRELPSVALHAAALAIAYARESQPDTKLDLQRIGLYDPSNDLVLDEVAVRNLELVRTTAGDRKGSLLALIDETRTSMGARLLRRRLLAPSTDIGAIRRRHDIVEVFVLDAPFRSQVRELLRRVSDLERLSTRASLGVATPRDLGAIASSLGAVRELVDLLSQQAGGEVASPLLAVVPEDPCDDIERMITDALVDEPPIAMNAGPIFREGVDARLDEARTLSSKSKDVILALQERERERTGVSSLKIRYTKVFGYYIEITKSKLRAVPDEYRRKQTVAGAERFVTDELSELEDKIEHADDIARSLEMDLFTDLRSRVGREARRLRTLAVRIAELDVHASLADVAHRCGYVRPIVDDSLEIELCEGRHPVVERLAAAGEFVPNDVVLDGELARLMVITGPNMAGKSTVMRQVALSVILAQAGSFVPAAKARIGIVDRVYTRVGASDNVGQGQSTFMVEMREAASILRGATRRSLVILDEIGRGTSTYDGLAIAWAVAEYLHDAVCCRAMFATHYHELCELAATRPSVVNYNVAAREYRGEVVFLHRLVQGGANRSYGIAVARLAGVPSAVLDRAKSLLRDLEIGAALPTGAHPSLRGKAEDGSAQLDLFEKTAPIEQASSEVHRALRALDLDRLTPLDALNVLAELKTIVGDDHG